MDLISVIVPVYNIERYVERCLKSIIKQTYENVEIILVDDGSKDKSGEICDRYAEENKRIKVIHQKNQGLSAARNKGIEIATGKYIAFIDGDDYIHKQFIEILYRELIDKNADIVSCDFERVDENRTVEDGSILKYDYLTFTGEEAFKARWTIYVMAWNKLYRKELFDTCRYPVGKIHEDEYIFHELMYQCKTVIHICACLYYYVIREGSIITDIDTFHIDCAKEALENRLKFCKDMNWGDTPKYAMEAIGEFAINKYFLVDDNRREAYRIYNWYKKIVVKNSEIKIKLKYRIFFLNPRMYCFIERLMSVHN